MRNKILWCAVGIVLVFLLSWRIYYVNQHARMPEVNQIAQGDSVSYRGLKYTVVEAELWEYADFFEQNQEWRDYEGEGEEYTGAKLLTVRYRIEKEEEENNLNLYIPIQLGNWFNGMDPFMTAAMNPSLEEGTFHSGDTVVIPYEIYTALLTDDQRREVEDLSAQYLAVLGTYPVRNELLISDVERK